MEKKRKIKNLALFPALAAALYGLMSCVGGTAAFAQSAAEESAGELTMIVYQTAENATRPTWIVVVSAAACCLILTAVRSQRNHSGK